MKTLLRLPVATLGLTLAAVLGLSFGARAQDHLYNQYFAAPMYQNPAFAGTSNYPRLINNMRNAATNNPGKFLHYSASVDKYFSRYNSGVALVFNYDKMGQAGLRGNEFGAQYAYQMPLSKKVFFRAGFQGSYRVADVAYSNLLFGDEIATGNPTQEVLPNLQTGFFNLSLGGLVYARNTWLSVAVHHVNQPDQGLLKDGTDILSPRINIYTGYKWFLQENCFEDEANYLSLLLNYDNQGLFHHLDFGGNIHYMRVLTGLHYHGFVYNSAGNRGDQFSLMGGYKMKQMTLMYAYSADLTNPSRAPRLGNSHEISLAFLIPTNGNKLDTYRRYNSKRYVPWPCL
jgi:type IX secretion system PorP/SprF family membrane protein